MLIVNPSADFVRIIRIAIGVYSNIDAAPMRYPNVSATDLSAVVVSPSSMMLLDKYVVDDESSNDAEPSDGNINSDDDDDEAPTG